MSNVSIISHPEQVNNISVAFDQVSRFSGRSLSLSSFENNSISQSGYSFFTQADLSRVGTVSTRIHKTSPVRDPDTSYKKRLIAFEQNVLEFVRSRGINNIGFVTFTFPDVPDWSTASSRWNSLNSNFLSKLEYWKGWILVREYQSRGSIHFHLLVDFGRDIRTGFDFTAVDKKDYRSASPFLRSVWKDMRDNLVKYGFGRSEVKPIGSGFSGQYLLPGSAQAETASTCISKYLSKYLSKSFKSVSDSRLDARAKGEKEWHGRYVSYSQGARVWSSVFQLSDGPGRWWRQRVLVFASVISDLCNTTVTWESVEQVLGRGWVYRWGDVIREMSLTDFSGNVDLVQGALASDRDSAIKLYWSSDPDPVLELCLVWSKFLAFSRVSKGGHPLWHTRVRHEP